ARMQPYDGFISVVFGIHEGAYGIVNSTFVSQLQEAYEPNGELSLEDVFHSVDDEIIDKVRDGGLAWTELKKSIVHDVLDTLTERERDVIGIRFGLYSNEPKTFEQAGHDFSVTRERVRQIEAKALRKLQHPMRSKKLKGLIGLATDRDVMAYKTGLEEQERREQEYLREGYNMKGEPNPFLEKPIDELEVSIRTKNCLDRLGVKTVEELVEYSQVDLLRSGHFGNKSLREVREELEGMKLYLR
ncbi:MAG: hypothetical protein KJ896_05560, partial [Nanoarchaeota archaeon]|nr:hypothetical protein [Nanoarchaeota archaeon]